MLEIPLIAKLAEITYSPSQKTKRWSIHSQMSLVASLRNASLKCGFCRVGDVVPEVLCVTGHLCEHFFIAVVPYTKDCKRHQSPLSRQASCIDSCPYCTILGYDSVAGCVVTDIS
jgi:hypothetical protein